MVRLGQRPKAADFNGPAKPASGYFAFCDLNRESVIAELKAQCAAAGNPFKYSEVGSILAERWKSYPEEKKAELHTVYEEKAKEYATVLEAWKKTDDFKKFLEAKRIYDMKKKTSAARKEMREAGAPKKARSAYFLFSTEMREKILKQWQAEGKKVEIQMIGKMCGDAWKKLSDEEKKPYYDRHIKEKAEYDVKQAEFMTTEAYQSYRAQIEKVSKNSEEVKKTIKQVGKEPKVPKEPKEPKVPKEKKPRKPRAKKSQTATEVAPADAPASEESKEPVAAPAQDVPMTATE